MSSLRVAGAEFARLDGDTVVFWLGPHESAARRDDVAADVVERGSGLEGLQVALADINGMQANALLTAAGEFHAPLVRSCISSGGSLSVSSGVSPGGGEA